MKLIKNTSAFIIACLLTCYVNAQTVRAKNIKQPPRMNGVVKATTNAAAKAKIHANSNSVFGTGNHNAKYNKKHQAKKEAMKKDEEVATNSRIKNQKNRD